MPTSSQALILYNHETGKEQHNVAAKSRSYYSLRDPARLSVASIYNINGLYSIPAVELKNEDTIYFLQTATTQLFKYHKLPKGFRSVISFDPLTKTFIWRILGGQAPFSEDLIIDNVEVNAEVEVAAHENAFPNIEPSRPITVNEETEVAEDKRTFLNIKPIRPTTVNYEEDEEAFPFIDTTRPTTVGGSKPVRHVVDRDLYERLLALGFRDSGFDVREVNKDSQLPSASTDIITPKRPIRQLSLKKTVSEPQKLAQSTCSTETEERRTQAQIPSPVTSDEDADADDESSSIDEDVDADGFYRILPSLCMRKAMPSLKPKSAIFSFRENELYNHLDVKNLIYVQSGLKVAGLQFDPVNLRASKPGIRSRWIVDFSSVADLESFIRNGLKIGKDKMIIYRYDDIAKREFSMYKYYKTIQDAKKCLKGSKSQKGTDKAKKVLKLKYAKSTVAKDLVTNKIERKRSDVR